MLRRISGDSDDGRASAENKECIVMSCPKNSSFRLIPVCLILLLGACGGAPEEPPAEPASTSGGAGRKIIYPAEFAEGSPFSPGVLAGDTLYLAGQVGRDQATRELPEDIASQTRLAMENIGLILKAAELDYSNLVKCHVLLDDMDNYQPMNETYGGFFEPGRYPARTTLEIAGLVGTAHVEISCIAFADKSRIEMVRPAEGTIPAAMGPYSPGVRAGDALYLSGQGGRDPETNEIAESVGAQAAQAIQNIHEVVQAAGLGLEDVVYTNAYFLGCDKRAELDSAFASSFPAGVTHPRSNLCLPRLPGTISTEITFFAGKGPQVDGTVYLPVRSSPESGSDIASQMSGTMEKLGKDLEGAGLDYGHVVNANVYLKNSDDFQGMNGVFREIFPENPPARTTVAILQEGDHEQILVEVALIAVK